MSNLWYPSVKQSPIQGYTGFGGGVTSAAFRSTAAAGGYCANWTIDGNAVTEEWVGGSAPSAGGSDGLDIYSFTIIKIGTGTGDSGFKVIANVSNAT